MTRRRGAELESAIFAAVEAELARVGYADLTVTAVAERAGTSKPVLYRRWPSRARLVYAAVAHNHHSVEVPTDTGALRSDLLEWMRLLAERTRELDPGTVWGLLAESATDLELLDAIRADLLAPGEREHMAEILRRAAARGDVPPGERTARQLTLPSELLRSEFLLRGRIDPHAIEAIVDDVLLPVVLCHPA